MGVQRSPRSGAPVDPRTGRYVSKGITINYFVQVGSREFSDHDSALAEIDDAILSASINAIRKAAEYSVSNLAIRSGRFRSTMDRVLEQETLVSMKDEHDFVFRSASAIEDVLEFDLKRVFKEVIAGVSYAQYHIDGKPHHPGDISPYDNPTIDGTEPFSTSDFLSRFFRDIRKEYRLEMARRGLLEIA